MKRIFKLGILTFVSLLCFYILSLTLVSCISNQAVQKNLYSSVDRLQAEDNQTGWVHPYFDKLGSATDNGTDIVMMDRNVLDEGKSPLYNAMDQRGYSRYWHGYQIFLRPMLLFFNTDTIRVVNMVVFYSLLMLVLLKIKDKIGNHAVFGFVIPLIFSFFFVIPLSMQYMNTFILAFIGMLILLSAKNRTKEKEFLLFLLLGSLTNFFDFLTTPLITLGLPLVIKILLDSETQKGIKGSFLEILKLSITWGLFYGITWIAKWLIGSFILNRNLIADALGSAKVWSTTTEIVQVNRLYAIKVNLLEMFHYKLIFIMSMLFLLGSLIFDIRSRNRLIFNQNILLILISVLPFLWYIVMPNHAQVHYYMTYRSLLVFCFPVFTIIFRPRGKKI